MSVLFFEVIYINPITMGIFEFFNAKDVGDILTHPDVESIQKIVHLGLNKLKIHGIGGKRSRGYGSLEVWELTNSDLFSIESKYKNPITVNRPVVFISHSSKDKSLARRLAQNLQEKQLKVWLDEKKILIGDSIHSKVEEGIQQCDYLVLLISQNSLESEWVKDELNAIRMREKKQKKIFLLPALLPGVEESKIPPLLRDRKYATFLPTYEKGLQEIIDAIYGHEHRER